MFEYRCPNCKKLLFKGNIKDGFIELKCRCGQICDISDIGGSVCMRRIGFSYEEYKQLKNK